MLLAIAMAVSLSPESEGAYKQPQLAVNDKMVAVTFGSGQSVQFAASTDGGSTFTKPVQVFPQPGQEGKLPIGRHRGPRIAFSGDWIVISAIVGQKGGGADGDLFSWRSRDSGKTWSKGVRVNDAEGSAREGLHAMAAGGGILFSTWLDLRGKGTKLYGSMSRDGGATWLKNTLVYESPDGTICQCCHPSVKVTAQGEVLAMWRNALGGSRDMYVARSTDGVKFTPAQKQGTGTWPLNACPMDGGDLTFTPEGKLWSAWRRDDRIVLAAPDGKEKIQGGGKDPAMALGKKGPVVAWTDHGLQLLAPGETSPRLLDPAGAFANLAAGSHVYGAWESGKSIRIARLD
ncbi:MAG TPA: sialidase family protein [Bryobacteraceae bacterium]|nr:sialidase family protein [Bryobacteraceae bacterium]